MSLKFVILGSGSSMGVPRADSYSGDCDLKNKKNFRTRCSALIKFYDQNILIDTSPDLRQQMISNKVKTINKVFYTHKHGDQTHGINDLRPFFLKNKKKIPVYADRETSKYLYSTFKYCFIAAKFYPTMLSLNKLKNEHIFVKKNKKIKVRAIPVKHGDIKSNCYIINDKLAYASDVSLIYQKDFKRLKKIDYLIIDCLWERNFTHSHLNLDKVLNLVKLIKPKKTILTNMSTDFDYNKLKIRLPKNIVPGYDGMEISL
jgi:phosphoribosyl 1,2-cyclic phosphate phosphodiesterase